MNLQCPYVTYAVQTNSEWKVGTRNELFRKEGVMKYNQRNSNREIGYSREIITLNTVFQLIAHAQQRFAHE